MPAAQQAAAAPAAEEGVPDAGDDPETAPLVELTEAVRVAVEDGRRGADDAESEAAKHAAAKEGAAKVVAETERAMEAWREAGPGPAAVFLITVSSVTGSVEIEVTAQMSVSELQSAIEEKLGTGKDQQQLQLKDGPVLQDDQLVLGAAGVQRGATVRMGLIEAAEGALRRELRAEARAAARLARKDALEVAEWARHKQEMALVARKNYKVLGASLLIVGGVVAAAFAADVVPRAEILLIEAVLLVLSAVGWTGCRTGCCKDAGAEAQLRYQALQQMRLEHQDLSAVERDVKQTTELQHRIDEKRAEENVAQRWAPIWCCVAVLATISFALVLPVVYDNTCWGYTATTRPSDYATAYTLSGCSDPNHCGTFLRTDSTCDCAPVYLMPSADGDGVFLYRQSWNEGSRWYVGLTPCTYWNNHYLQSGQADKPRTPDHEEYSATPRTTSTPPLYRWERCTSQALDGELLGFTMSVAEMQSGYASRRACDGFADDIDVVASDGADLCAGVDCGMGECRDGICSCTDGIFAGIRCEGNCTDHGGATADGARCASCTGHWVGHICQRACDCSGRGTQTDLPGARAAGSCYGGTCVDCADNFAGALCATSCGAHGSSNGSTCTCEGEYLGESCQHLCSRSGGTLITWDGFALIDGTRVTPADGEFCQCRRDSDGKWVGATCDVYDEYSDGDVDWPT